MQSLNSPYIVCYYDSFIDGEEKPTINIVIEYCHNGDLSTFIEKQDKLEKQNKYLNENLVWKLFINLCLGLEHMHSKDIIHRDLKSLNIFITKDQVAKIGDLGCAMNLNDLKILEENKEIHQSHYMVMTDVE